MDDDDLDLFKASPKLDHVQLALSLLEKAQLVTLQGELASMLRMAEVIDIAQAIEDVALKDLIMDLLLN